MAECKFCKANIPDGEEYCEKCFENNRAKMDESYLDSLLKSVINIPENQILYDKKVLPDMKSDFENGNINKILSADKGLLNKYRKQNFTKQDEKIMRDEYDKENELDKSTEEDVILPQDYSDEGTKEEKTEENTAYYDYDENPEMEDTDEDLLALLDMISAQDEAETVKKEENLSDVAENDFRSEHAAKERPAEEEALSIDDLVSEISEDSISQPEKEHEKSGSPNDVGGIFSDVVSVIDTLQDKEESDLNNQKNRASLEKEDTKEINQDKKKGFWQKIFGKKNNAEAEISEQDDNTPEIDKKSNKKKEEEIKKKTGNKKKAIKEKQSQKKSSEGEEDEDVKSKKSEAKNKADKAEKKKSVKKKAVKKVKQDSPAKNADIASDGEDNIKVNKLAVIFIMTFFILIGGFVILGTNLYSYSLGVKNANLEFSRKRYTNAYNEIYGLDIREKDSELYQKIMTVMFVNKELNSYNNYIDMNKYPEALDSLLKGLERYDKYIERATELGIKEDLAQVKEQILTELKRQFNITEEEAIVLNSSMDQTQYSINVINTVLEKME